MSYEFEEPIRYTFLEYVLSMILGLALVGLFHIVWPVLVELWNSIQGVF